MSVIDFPRKKPSKPKIISFIGKKKERLYRRVFFNSVPENIFSKYSQRIINGELTLTELLIILTVATRGASTFQDEVEPEYIEEAHRYLDYRLNYDYLMLGFKCNYESIGNGLKEDFYTPEQAKNIVRKLNENNVNPFKLVTGKENLEARLF